MSPSKSPDGGSGPVPSNQQDSHISKEEKEPATLTSLPNELILEICKSLKKRGRISLCNTSRQLHACIAPLIYSSIVISTKSQYYRRNNLLQTHPRLALYVKKLVIRDEDEEYRGRSEHIHLQEGLVSTLSDLTHLSLQYGWTHWQGLLGLPLNLPHLRSLIFCSLKFQSWCLATDNIRKSWILLTHPTLEHLSIEFPLDEPPDNQPQGPFPDDLDLDALRGTTNLKALRLIRVPPGAALARILALPRQLDSLALHAPTLGLDPDPGDPTDCLEPLFHTLRRLELAIAAPSSSDDDGPHPLLHLGKFKAVTVLRIPVAQTRAWPLNRGPEISSSFPSPADLLPPNLETLTLFNWNGRPQSHGMTSRLLDLTEAVSSSSPSPSASAPGSINTRPILRAWRALALEVGGPTVVESVGVDADDVVVAVPAALLDALRALGVGVSVRLWGGEAVGFGTTPPAGAGESWWVGGPLGDAAAGTGTGMGMGLAWGSEEDEGEDEEEDEDEDDDWAGA